jgi:hypothetical protein
MPTGWQVADLTTTNPFIIGPWSIWNRRYAKRPSPYTAPYSRAYLRIIAHAAAVSTLDVNIAALDKDGSPKGGVNHVDSVSVTSAAETAYTFTTAYVDLDPGQNLIKITFSSSTTGVNAPIVDALSLCQIVKQTH